MADIRVRMVVLGMTLCCHCQVRDAGLNGRVSEESRKIVADSPLLSRSSSLSFNRHNTSNNGVYTYRAHL